MARKVEDKGIVESSGPPASTLAHADVPDGGEATRVGADGVVHNFDPKARDGMKKESKVRIDDAVHVQQWRVTKAGRYTSPFSPGSSEAKVGDIVSETTHALDAMRNAGIELEAIDD